MLNLYDNTYIIADFPSSVLSVEFTELEHLNNFLCVLRVVLINLDPTFSGCLSGVLPINLSKTKWEGSLGLLWGVCSLPQKHWLFEKIANDTSKSGIEITRSKYWDNNSDIILNYSSSVKTTDLKHKVYELKTFSIQQNLVYAPYPILGTWRIYFINCKMKQ